MIIKDIYRYPYVSGGSVADRMMKVIIPAFLLLGAAMAFMFISMGEDSAANRNAVHKVTSFKTEMSVLAVFVIFLADVVFISIAGIIQSRRRMRNFTVWVNCGEKLYNIRAEVPRGRVNAPAASMNRIVYAQQRAVIFLNDSEFLEFLTDGGEENGNFTVTDADGVRILKTGKKGIKIQFKNGIKTFVYSEINDYASLKGLIEKNQDKTGGK